MSKLLCGAVLKRQRNAPVTENPLSLRLLSFRNADKGRRLKQIPVRSIGTEGWPDPRLVSLPSGRIVTFGGTGLEDPCFPPVLKPYAVPLLQALRAPKGAGGAAFPANKKQK